jgi:hypothetical protein
MTFYQTIIRLYIVMTGRPFRMCTVSAAVKHFAKQTEVVIDDAIGTKYYECVAGERRDT